MKMPTSQCVIKNNFKKVLSNKGFSLIEILVALLLVVGIIAITTIGTNPGRDSLDEMLFLMERSVRFSNDEAILRNTVTRIHYFLDKEPQEFAVEFGPDSDFTLPLGFIDRKSYDVLSEREKKERDEETKSLNQKFNKIQDFQENNKKMEGGITIVAMATTLNENIFSENEAAIYVFPNGEKDGAIIVLSSYEELASISFEPFSFEFEYNYYPIEGDFIDEEEREQFVYNKALEIIKTWQSQK